MKRNGTFVLYSIGDDGVDDGGDPASRTSTRSVGWDRGRDYVWPAPASEEEIEIAGESRE